ncbi:hypothetical protein [Nocardioides iriomotensis]|uniref:Uncharacterized protein n=1 Tax=Nocardioides iriomotensis TaxID=715784 RepID=A0A4Q5J6F5_9ACTN|nr:hypothetical protein [Nocardioides iriomotensis]RYU13438.1 hypothetical protein ETU37_06300 [Nocardioides iriomotensis]
MKGVLVTVAAVAATAVVGTAVPVGLTLSATGSEQAPAAKVSGKPQPHPQSQKERRAHLDAWKAWKKEQQKAWRADDSHEGPPPWAGGPWKTGPAASAR